MKSNENSKLIHLLHTHKHEHCITSSVTQKTYRRKEILLCPKGIFYGLLVYRKSLMAYCGCTYMVDICILQLSNVTSGGHVA